MIVLDTSVLVDALCGDMNSEPAIRAALMRSEQLLLPSLVLFEWLRGPRRERELQTQEALLPSDRALPFGSEEAAEAATLEVEKIRAEALKTYIDAGVPLPIAAEMVGVELSQEAPDGQDRTATARAAAKERSFP